MPSAPHITASRMYHTLVALSDGENPHDVDDLDRPALRKLLRLGYLRPARFADAPRDPKGFMRPVILAYAVTDEGQAFVSRHEDAGAIRDGRMVETASGWESSS